jgi:regulator of protease activity HflC (stomatin/prohibitin superfamily)
MNSLLKTSDFVLRIIFAGVIFPCIVGIALLITGSVLGVSISYALLGTLIITIAYSAVSFNTVQNDEKAILERLGEPIEDLEHGAGLVFAPLGIWSITIEKTPTVTVELPGPKTRIFHGSDHETLPDGKVRPFRITSSSRNNFDGLRFLAKEYFAKPGDPTMRPDARYENLISRVEEAILRIKTTQSLPNNETLGQQTFMLQLFLRARIKSPKYFQRNVGRYSLNQQKLAVSDNPYIGDDEYSKLRFEISQMAKTLTQEICGKLTMSAIIENTGEINLILQAFMSAKVDGNDGETSDTFKVTDGNGNEIDQKIRKDSLGIVIEEAKIITPDPGKTSSAALQTRAIASVEAKSAEIKANADKLVAKRQNEAEEDRLIKIGAGEAAALQARLAAEALGYKEIADKLGIKNPLEIYKIQQLLDILPKSNAQFIIGGDAGLNELFARIKNISKP